MEFRNPVLIVRHGETEWKRQGRTQGQDDSPLTECGVLQVQDLAHTLSGNGFDLIVTSPLGRAVQTSEILAPGYEPPSRFRHREREGASGRGDRRSPQQVRGRE